MKAGMKEDIKMRKRKIAAMVVIMLFFILNSLFALSVNCSHKDEDALFEMKSSSKHNLTVYVYDAETNTSIGGATVKVHPYMIEMLYTNTTNSTGYATFQLEEDEYYIEVVDAVDASKRNYGVYNPSMFTLNQDLWFNIPLTPSQPHPEHNLTVYALVGILTAIVVISVAVKIITKRRSK